MAKVLVLYYSSYGHVEALANAIAETNARISARSTVVTEGPAALTCLAGNINQTPRCHGVRNRSCLLTGISHINVPLDPPQPAERSDDGNGRGRSGG